MFPRSTATGPLGQDEFEALEQFYTSLGGPDVIFSDPAYAWDFNSADALHAVCSTWEGLSCVPSRANQNLSSISAIILQPTLDDSGSSVIFSYNLNGPLPSALTRLPLLANLRLAGCDGVDGCRGALHGTLPSFLSTMTNLEAIRLPRNRLSGTLSSSLGGLKSLTLLSLWGNSIEGSLPSELGLMSSLTTASLKMNRFVGRLPSELAELPTLNYLTLQNNLLTGPLPEAFSPALTQFEIGSNFMTGPIPEGLWQCRLLDTLDLQNNHFTSSVSSSVANLEAITIFSVSNNRLTSTLPVELFSLTNLVGLFFAGNSFEGSLPSQVGQLRHLTQLQGNANKLTGALPSEELGGLESIAELNLGNNKGISGTISPAFGRLTALSALYLDSMNLTGTLPAEVVALPSISELHLDGNRLTGKLPDATPWSSTLTLVSIGLNSFSGPIPSSLCAAVSLAFLDVGGNLLTGSAPSCLTSLMALEILSLRNNLLNKQLPEALSWPALRMLDVSNNFMTGTLSPSVGLLTNLLQLVVQNNSFSGPIPSEIWQISTLSQLNAGSNRFTGTIWSGAGKGTPQLSYLLLSNNLMTGQIPPSLLRELPKMTNLVLGKNRFVADVGPLLESLGQGMPELQVLELSENKLYGSITSAGLASLRSLNELYLWGNSITGSLPSAIGLLSRLIRLEMRTNLINGTIPTSIGSMVSLQELYLGDMKLVGGIPTSLASLARLRILVLSGNMLTNAQVGWTFLSPASTQPMLEVVDLSSNALSGSSLPVEWVEGSSLRVLSLSANCLQQGASLSTRLCNSTALSTLVLDGVTSGPTCKALFWGPGAANSLGLNGTYSLSSLSGGVPACLLSLPTMEVLHLSGNGLQGSIPDVVLSPSLRDLSLSYNRLGGTVPDSVQNSLAQLSSCDLSYNRFFGSFHGQLPTSGGGAAAHNSLSLRVNALSGPIPSSWRQALNVTVLDGNVFSCSADRSDLPKRDPYLSQFQCGSDVVDNAMISFLVIVVSGAVLVLVFLRRRLVQTRAKLKAYLLATAAHDSLPAVAAGKLEAPSQDQVHNAVHEQAERDASNLMMPRMSRASVSRAMQRVLRHDNNVEVATALYEMKRLRRVSLLITALSVVLLMPAYGGLSQLKYGVLSNLYAWAVTAAYKKGEVPAAVFVLLWTLTVAAVIILVLFQYYQSGYPYRAATAAAEAAEAAEAAAAKSGDEEGAAAPSQSSEPARRAAKGEKAPRRAHPELKGLVFILLVARSALLVAVNLVVVLSMHYMYVHVLLNGTIDQQNAATWGLSAFKIVWEAAWLGLVPRLVRCGASPEAEASFVAVYCGGGLLVTLCKMFNAVVAPLLVTTLTDSTCFKNTLIAPPPVTAQWSYTYTSYYNFTMQGKVFSGSNDMVDTSSTVFSPPYAYTFKCGSVLIAAFSPVFILDALQELCLSPLTAALTYWAKRLWRQMHSKGEDAAALAKAQAQSDSVDALDFVDFFNKGSSDCLLMLTFGLLNPLVAVAKALTLHARTWQAQDQVVVYLETREDASALFAEAAKLERSPLHQARWAFVAVPSALLAFFATDVAGYQSGTLAAYVWAPAVMGLLPFFFVGAVYHFASRFLPGYVTAHDLEDALVRRARRERRAQKKRRSSSAPGGVGPRSSMTLALQHTPGSLSDGDVEMAPARASISLSAPSNSLSASEGLVPWLPGLGQGARGSFSSSTDTRRL